MTTIVEEAPVITSGAGKKKSYSRKPFPKSAPKKLTVAQAEKIANGRSFELIDGEVVYKMPDNKHSDTQSLLGGALTNYFVSNPTGRMRTEFMIRPWPDRPHEGRTPDLSVILNENLNPEERYASRAPDIAIEIVSLDDGWNALFEKATLYLEHGSREVWIVDPFQRGVEIVTPRERRWVNDVLTSPLLPGLSVSIKDIFDWPAAESK